jgi:hypothetical protein
MKNTVSLHKIWIARTAGLFVLTALAVAYFAFPALTMAKVVQAPQLLTTVKADFMGLVSAPLPNLVDANGKLIPIPANAALDLTRNPKVPLANLKKGAWIAVNLTDPTDHQAYGFTATINSIDPTTGKIELLIGTPSSTAMTSQAVIQKFEGNFVFLNLVKDVQGNVIVPPGLSSSGWGATAIIPSAPAPKPVTGAPSTVKTK